MFCIASATQDIAIDGYTIGLVDRGREGPIKRHAHDGVSRRARALGKRAVAVARLARLARDLSRRGGAHRTVRGVARADPPIPLPPPAQRQPLHSLFVWLARPGVVPVIAFVILFRIGDQAMGPMLPTFWVDRGFSDAEIALMANLLGAGAMITGAIAGGTGVARAGIVPALWATGALALVSNLVYAAAAAWPESGRNAVYAASLLEAFTGGAVGAAFVSYLMRICEREHAAVQYAVVTGLYASMGTLLGTASGKVTEAVGYAGYFALTAVFAAPAFAFLARAARWIEPVAEETH